MWAFTPNFLNFRINFIAFPYPDGPPAPESAFCAMLDIPEVLFPQMDISHLPHVSVVPSPRDLLHRLLPPPRPPPRLPLCLHGRCDQTRRKGKPEASAIKQYEK